MFCDNSRRMVALNNRLSFLSCTMKYRYSRAEISTKVTSVQKCNPWFPQIHIQVLFHFRDAKQSSTYLFLLNLRFFAIENSNIII